MPAYKVIWTCEIDADTPEDAARIARGMHLDPGSEAVVFEVFDGDRESFWVDLYESPYKDFNVVLFKHKEDVLADRIIINAASEDDAKYGAGQAYPHSEIVSVTES